MQAGVAKTKHNRDLSDSQLKDKKKQALFRRVILCYFRWHKICDWNNYFTFAQNEMFAIGVSGLYYVQVDSIMPMC